MVSRRSVILGGGGLLTGGSLVAVGMSLQSNSRDTTGNAGDVIVRNRSKSAVTVQVKIERWYEATECRESDQKEDNRCYHQVFSERFDLKQDEFTLITDAYTKPGQYRVQAQTDEEHTDTHSGIELWTEESEVTGMGTEVIILPSGTVEVLGFINSGTRNPPPDNK